MAKPERRRFTADYKQKVLREADNCRQPGEIGALLRREGLYGSNLANWRKQRERGELAGLSTKKRGPKRGEKNPLAEVVRKNRNVKVGIVPVGRRFFHLEKNYRAQRLC